MSAYEGEYMIFGLLGQANLTQNDVLITGAFFFLCVSPTLAWQTAGCFAFISHAM
jgi:branched-subunit amino acid ABC-type transport system permease component